MDFRHYSILVRKPFWCGTAIVGCNLLKIGLAVIADMRDLERAHCLLEWRSEFLVVCRSPDLAAPTPKSCLSAMLVILCIFNTSLVPVYKKQYGRKRRAWSCRWKWSNGDSEMLGEADEGGVRWKGDMGRRAILGWLLLTSSPDRIRMKGEVFL